VHELSRVEAETTSDDHEDRLWGFNVQRHLYFQWLGCSKNNTPHNLDVRSSVFESHEAKLISSDQESSRSYLSRNRFELLVKSSTAFVTLLASRS